MVTVAVSGAVLRQSVASVAVTLDRRGETRPAWIEMASSQNWSRLTSQIGDGSTPIKEVK